LSFEVSLPAVTFVTSAPDRLHQVSTPGKPWLLAERCLTATTVAYRCRVAVKAWLEGHQFDLQDVADLLSSGRVRVIHDANDDAFYLISPALDSPPQPGRFDIPAEKLLDLINGLARANNSGFRPVRLSGRYTDSSGRTIHMVTAKSEARAVTRVTAVVLGPDGQPRPDPPSPWPDRLALAETNPDVARVLEILGRGDALDWYNLYKVYEIVRDAIKPEELHKLGWTTKKREGAFTGSANLYSVSGNEARHAVDKSGDPPKETMTQSEGRSYISDLVAKWLGRLT